MADLKEITSTYQEMRNEVQKIRDRIKQREEQIERLKKKQYKKSEFWGDLLIRPIMSEVKNRFKELTWDDERLVPMGLRSAVSLFAKDENNETVASLVFVLGDYNKGDLYIESGLRKDNNYKGGTIGDLNGFNNKLIRVESLDTVFNRVGDQLKGIFLDL